jgi:hypothetical protein
MEGRRARAARSWASRARAREACGWKKSPSPSPKQRASEQRDRQFAPRAAGDSVSGPLDVSFPNFDKSATNVFLVSRSKAFDSASTQERGRARRAVQERVGPDQAGCNLSAIHDGACRRPSGTALAVTERRGARFSQLAPGRKSSWRAVEPKIERPAPDGRDPRGETASTSGPRGRDLGPVTDKFGLPRGRHKRLSIAAGRGRTARCAGPFRAGRPAGYAAGW